MTISSKKPNELTMVEFMALVRETVRSVLEEERHSAISSQRPQRGIIDIEPLSMGTWTGEVAFIKREDYYDDSGR